jgi:hypothetical protein
MRASQKCGQVFPLLHISGEPQHLASLKIFSVSLLVGSVKQQHKSNITPAQTKWIPANNAQQWLLTEIYKPRSAARARFENSLDAI